MNLQVNSILNFNSVSDLRKTKKNDGFENIQIQMKKYHLVQMLLKVEKTFI